MQEFTPFGLKGTFKPIVPRRTQSRAWEGKCLVGNGGKFDAVCSVYVMPPSIQYPKTSARLQFSSGGNSAYTGVNPQQLRDFASSLSDWADKVEECIRNLEPQSILCQSQSEEYYKQLEQIQQLQQLAKQSGAGDNQE